MYMFTANAANTTGNHYGFVISERAPGGKSCRERGGTSGSWTAAKAEQFDRLRTRLEEISEQVKRLRADIRTSC